MNFKYIQNTLLSDEQLTYVTHPHWIVFGTPFAALLVSLFVLFDGPRLFFSAIAIIYGLPVYVWVSLAFLLYAIYSGLKALIYYSTSEYGVTDKRVLMKVGWIQRDSLELFLRRVEGIKVYQSVMGRILNYGTIIIIGTGGTKDPFYYIPDPLSFRRRIQREMELDIKPEGPTEDVN